jgi:hypothetical protein
MQFQFEFLRLERQALFNHCVGSAKQISRAAVRLRGHVSYNAVRLVALTPVRRAAGQARYLNCTHAAQQNWSVNIYLCRFLVPRLHPTLCCSPQLCFHSALYRRCNSFYSNRDLFIGRHLRYVLSVAPY